MLINIKGLTLVEMQQAAHKNINSDIMYWQSLKIIRLHL